MIVDIRSLPDRSTIDCDLCIIGGGAAGITIALEQIGRQANVVLLESGGFDFDADTQHLYAGEDVGIPYFDLEVARLRFFGGTTNHWAGWCRPLEPQDFEARDWVPHSGWPIPYADYASYLGRAAERCQLKSYDFDFYKWLAGTGAKLDREAFAPLLPAFVPSLFWMSPPTRFGQEYRGALDRAANVKVLLNANVTAIDAVAAPGTVDSLAVASLDGKHFTVKPKVVVLATGGIENARLLLASRGRFKDGLGNQNGLVGRYFADHIELTSGYILASAKRPAIFNLLNRYHASLTNNVSLDSTWEMQRENKILNMDFTLSRVASEAQTSDGFGALRRIGRAVSLGKWPKNFFSDVGTALGDIDKIISYGLSKIGKGDQDLFVMYNRCEVAPNPESSVSLGNAVDRLGMPQVKLNWQLTELDYRSIRTTQVVLAQILGQAGLGKVKIELAPVFEHWPDVLQGGYHHLGTTRMAADAKQGVVDTNCRVFGLENLYVAGSSVFPTTGRANPTFSILALALRLSDHLKRTWG